MGNHSGATNVGMTEPEAAKLVAMLATAWPEGLRWQDEHQQAEQRRLYRQFLLDLPYAAGDAAVVRLIATWKPTAAQRWPSIADLRAAIAEQLAGRRMLGAEVWGEICRLVRRYGAHRTPGVDFEVGDPVVAAVISEIGWRELCLSEERVADRARVIELADQLGARETTDRVVGRLAPPIPQRRLAAPEPLRLAGILESMLPDKGKEHT